MDQNKIIISCNLEMKIFVVTAFGYLISVDGTNI